MSDDFNPYQAPAARSEAPAPAAESGLLELTESQCVRIGKLSGLLRFVGGATLALTILHTGAVVLQEKYVEILPNLFQFIAGYFAWQAGSALRSVLTARSNPLPEMRRSLENLLGFYTVYFLIIVLLLLVFFGAILIAILGISLARQI